MGLRRCCIDFTSRQVVGSREAALETLRLLRKVVSKARFSNIEQLINLIRSVGKRLVEAQPKGMPSIYFQCAHLMISPEHSVGNTVRKILHHIREEYNTASASNGQTTAKLDLSISNFILQGQMRKLAVAQKSEVTITLKEDDSNDPDSFARALKPVLMEAIQDVLDELETVYDNISKSAKDHIHPEYVEIS